MVDARGIPPIDVEASPTDAIRDLRLLADAGLPVAGQEVILRRLAGTPELARVLELVGRGLEAEMDDFELEDEDTEEDEAPDDDLSVLFESAAPPPGLPPMNDVLGQLRARDIAHTLAALRELGQHAADGGALALVADAGDPAARRELAERVQETLNSVRPSHLVEAAHDPFLRQLSDVTGGAVTILDGDLAPQLVDLLEERRHHLYAVIVPDAALRELGRLLEPDLVLGLAPARLASRPDRVSRPETIDLARAVGLESDGRDTVSPVAVPTGADLAEAIMHFVHREMLHGPDRGERVLQTLRRLSLGPDASIVKRVLRESWGELDVAFGATELHHRLAWSALYRDLGLYDQAAGALDRTPRQPDQGLDPRIRHALAHLMVLRGDPGGAIEQLARLDVSSPIRAHTLAKAYRLTGNLVAATDAAATGLAADPANLYLLIEAGIIASWRRRPRVADAFFARAHRVAPRCGAVLNAWGRASALAGLPDRAERLLLRAATIEPWNERHLLELGLLATSRGLIDEAEALLRPLAGSNRPSARRAAVQLVDTLLDAGSPRQADAEALLSQLEEEPADQTDTIRLASLRMHLLARSGALRAALRHADETNLTNVYLAAQTITVCLLDRSSDAPIADREGRIDRALKRLDDANAVDPHFQRVTATLRARVLAARHDLAGARAVLEAALMVDPAHPALLNTLADIEREAGRREDAEALYRTALDIDPRNAFTHRSLAALLRSTGQITEAEQSERYVRFVGLSLDAASAPSASAIQIDL